MHAGAALLLVAALPLLPALVGVAGGEVVAVPGGAGAGPAFSPRQHTAVVAPLGHAAVLHCSVLRLQDKSVSWVRSRDLQILSHAGDVFTADARVTATSAAGDGAVTTHSLKIEQLRASDGGRYECQVNTEPKMSLFFNLTVVDEEVGEVVVQSLGVRMSNGAAELGCEARYSPPPRLLPLPALTIRWSRHGEPLDLQSPRGGVSLDTSRWAGGAVSRLSLSRVTATDEGLYTCSVAGQSTTIRIELPHDRAEAMQQDEAPSSARRLAALHSVLLVALLLLLLRRHTCTDVAH